MKQGAIRSRVLVVEDEASIRVGLCDILRLRGFDVSAAEDGAKAMGLAREQRFDLFLLDVMLPELDGFSVCQQLRSSGVDVPVLMLTARGSEDDILRGFEVGADDYVTKPFSVRELVARVQALLKRSARLYTESFRVGPFEIDPERSLATAQERSVDLTAREVQILRLLRDNEGRIVSRRTLLREVWGMNNVEQVETRTVDVHIAKLRKKLRRGDEALVETVRGQGYRLCTVTS